MDEDRKVGRERERERRREEREGTEDIEPAVNVFKLLQLRHIKRENVNDPIGEEEEAVAGVNAATTLSPLRLTL